MVDRSRSGLITPQTQFFDGVLKWSDAARWTLFVKERPSAGYRNWCVAAALKPIDVNVAGAPLYMAINTELVHYNAHQFLSEQMDPTGEAFISLYFPGASGAMRQREWCLIGDGETEGALIVVSNSKGYAQPEGGIVVGGNVWGDKADGFGEFVTVPPELLNDGENVFIQTNKDDASAAQQEDLSVFVGQDSTLYLIAYNDHGWLNSGDWEDTGLIVTTSGPGQSSEGNVWRSLVPETSSPVVIPGPGVQTPNAFDTYSLVVVPGLPSGGGGGPTTGFNSGFFMNDALLDAISNALSEGEPVPTRALQSLQAGASQGGFNNFDYPGYYNSDEYTPSGQANIGTDTQVGFRSDSRAAASQLALYIATGAGDYAANMASICRSWSVLNQFVSQGNDPVEQADLEMSWYIVPLVSAAQTLEFTNYNGWTAADRTGFVDMLERVAIPTMAYPVTNRTDNWIYSISYALGLIHCYRQEKQDFIDVFDYFMRSFQGEYNPPGPGFVSMTELSTGRSAEQMRDSVHAWYGVSSVGQWAELARSQGFDLYGFANGAFPRWVEYTAELLLNRTSNPVFSDFEGHKYDDDPQPSHGGMDQDRRGAGGQFRPIGYGCPEGAFRYGQEVLGLSMPWTDAYLNGPQSPSNNFRDGGHIFHEFYNTLLYSTRLTPDQWVASDFGWLTDYTVPTPSFP